ncbi:MAG UNVERIFIED_CONTAM: 4a-hydroxytetrahydrobiopterin dehydratase [Planctomycetaceae bacterium]
MSIIRSAAELCESKCVPCEGGVPRMLPDEAKQQLLQLRGWELLEGPDRIRKCWTVKHFRAGMEFFRHVEALSEAAGHHPDLHLTAYRQIAIEIWTHAIHGLSLNDFILAAQIDQIPVQLRNPEMS